MLPRTLRLQELPSRGSRDNSSSYQADGTKAENRVEVAVLLQEGPSQTCREGEPGVVKSCPAGTAAFVPLLFRPFARCSGIAPHPQRISGSFLGHRVRRLGDCNAMLRITAQPAGGRSGGVLSVVGGDNLDPTSALSLSSPSGASR